MIRQPFPGPGAGCRSFILPPILAHFPANRYNGKDMVTKVATVILFRSIQEEIATADFNFKFL